MQVVALLGNGCSIPYNDGLAMGPLTRRILQQMAPTAEAEEVVAEALHRLAQASTHDEEERVRVFEELLGPLERVGRGLAALGDIAQQLQAATAFNESLRRAQDLAEDLRRRTLGVALDVVSQLSTGQGAAFSEPLTNLVRWLYDQARTNGTARVFTLNYDALVDSAALEVSEPNALSDMAVGYTDEPVRLMPCLTVQASPLRDDDEYTRRMVLYHLHGSLQWVRSGTRVWKVVELDLLRDHGFWGAYANGETCVEPAVILADQKVRAVGADPFQWAYRRFERSLLSADGLVIAGYGFGDVPVNRTLDRAMAETEYPVICIDKTDNFESARTKVLGAMPKLEPQRLILHTEGIETVVPHLAWRG